MGKFQLKPGSGLVQPSAAKPSVRRTMHEELNIVRHAESNSSLQISIQTNGLSRIVIPTDDAVPSFTGSALESSPSPSVELPTVTKKNSYCIDINSRFDSPCSSPGSKIISLKRKSFPETGPNQVKKNRNAGWQADNGTLVSGDPLFESSISQQTLFRDTPSPEFLCCENTIDTDNGTKTAGETNDESIAVDNDDEFITLDVDTDFIECSDDELTEPIQRFDRFSPADGPSNLPQKVPNDNHTHQGMPSSRSCMPSDCEERTDERPEFSSRYVSACATDDLLLEASARYRLSRKRKIGSMNPNPATVLESPSHDGTSQKRVCNQIDHPTESNDVVDALGTSENAQNTFRTCCRLPFNGHREDEKHYRFCEIALTGVILRSEHASWLSDIPSHSDIMEVVNWVIGSSCQQIMLHGKCSNEHCLSKHIIDLNFDVSHKHFNRIFNVFTKWFLQNALQPDFRAVLIVLSHISKVHNDILMIALSYARMILKLPNKVYRQALCIKLKEIMVNILDYKPWEAVRALLVFTVTSETELSDVLDLLRSLEVVPKHPSENKHLKNRLYESVSCLWHISETFVCPGDLLFQVLKECLVQMPTDLKLTKDRMVADLLKLPRSRLRKEFLFIDKVLGKYYPQNSEIVHVVRTSILYGTDVSNCLRHKTYEISRVKGTGPVNPQWDYWDIREARLKGFDFVMKNSRKNKPQEEMNFRRGLMDLPLENPELDVWNHDLFKIISSRNCLWYKGNPRPYDFSVEKPNNFECLVESLISGKYGQVEKIISSCAKSNSFEECLQTLLREFERCDKGSLGIVVFEILMRLPGSVSDRYSIKSGFVRMLNSLVVKFYKKTDYRSAVKLLKTMRLAGVNHLDHVPESTDQQTFAIICSDINFRSRLYHDAIRSLMYKDCLNIVVGGVDMRFTEHLETLEKLVKNMFQRFLKERHASHAWYIFRLIFTAQESLRFPLDIGKYYEGVIFLSFVSDLKKNACSLGSGADLYITVERVCGNDERFHSITYRSLLVELHRANSPEDIIRRTLQTCLRRKIYPDFSSGPISPLVLDSHLAREEMSIYLNHLFAYSIAQNDHQLTDRPFVVEFLESPPPDKKLFPVSNDIMKTPRSIHDAVDRFKSVLVEMSGEIYQTLNADFSQDRVTIPVEGVETLLRVFKR